MVFKKIVSVVGLTFLLLGCGGGGSSSESIKFDTKEKLGESLFFDQNLSLDRKTSCATCHDPEHAFVDARFSRDGVDQSVFIHGALSVGDDGSALGGRNTPTAAYAMLSPEFTITKGEPKGGQFHDGRAVSLKDQAMRPLLDQAEMMMESKAAVIDRIEENSDYVEAFKALYGEDIFDDINASYDAMGESIAAFEKTDEFAPFDSKYDRYVACKENGRLTSQCLSEGNWTIIEQGGMDIFFRPNNSSCVNCHQLKPQSEASGETFTNYEYHNIGTPKNTLAVQARAMLGLGEANTTEHGVYGAYPDKVNASKDGAVKVPTLRNVAVTAPYMHNGVFNELRTVLEFYDHIGGPNRRPNNPETDQAWGTPDVNGTINHEDLAMQELTDAEIDALEAFLKTLTDRRYEHLLK
jgi:cytochrome c peroxidase